MDMMKFDEAFFWERVCSMRSKPHGKPMVESLWCVHIVGKKPTCVRFARMFSAHSIVRTPIQYANVFEA